ncbi:MAG: acyltransferase family protein [Burkholderiales bacterium]
MGTLRTIFALSVVFAHSSGAFVFVEARNAVQLFYMISGFLMSYVLANNPAYANPLTFYKSRALRLYPMYFAVAAASLPVWIFFQPGFLDVYGNIPFDAKLLLTASNLLLIGQDWLMFCGIDNGRLVLTHDFSSSDIPLYEGLLVPQAWTLGVELSFYALAPFILRDKRKIVLLLLASLVLRALLVFNGIGLKDPWTYRFFPLELALFLIGALSRQVLLPVWQRFASLRGVSVGTGVLVAFSIVYALIPLSDGSKTLLLFAVFAIGLPLAFMFQNAHPLDSAIGELSYPIYICHVLVIWWVKRVADITGMVDTYTIDWLSITASVLVAALLNHAVGGRIESLRMRLKSTPSLAHAAA